ncbi:NUDIX domain-containing protein [Pelagibius sp. Alg239-R121]|uniref:NUDIX hydrolase n=1 Tax=Pelagibius sp. Alg239-R121 TaxID=2993448 RepID=UPI0024A66B60|nr:NUDIX domain-containing protein [Pelagibius sp. Alg239-R121]
MPNEMTAISTVDAVVLSILEGELKVLLHCRPVQPYEGSWALPGGFIRVDEDADAESAIRRILKDKAGVTGLYLEQLATYSGPDRDPRGWSISIAHLALVPGAKLAIDEGKAALVSIDDLPKLPFDHGKIIKDAVARLRGKGAYSTLPASFLGKNFTLTEMQSAYETALGTRVDSSSFRRKVLSLGILTDTGRSRQGDNRRPAKVYRLTKAVGTFDRTLGHSAG